MTADDIAILRHVADHLETRRYGRAEAYIRELRRIANEAEAENQPSFTCPTCSMTSYNPTDIAERYCGNCHAFK
jgi:ribosomal protein L37AE/L43A